MNKSDLSTCFNRSFLIAIVNNAKAAYESEEDLQY